MPTKRRKTRSTATPPDPRPPTQARRRTRRGEHRALGEGGGGAGRRIRLPNGIELTYGQIVALSGDFYRSPEALLAAPANELQQILAVMERERTQASASSTHAPSADEVNANNAAYELATTGHDRQGYRIDTLGGDRDGTGGPHGEVREGEHVESGAPGAQASFLDLASDNAAHFSPENIRNNWIPKHHKLALDLARQAWQARHPGALPTPTTQGTAASAREGETPDPQAPRAPGPDTRPGIADASISWGSDPDRQRGRGLADLRVRRPLPDRRVRVRPPDLRLGRAHDVPGVVRHEQISDRERLLGVRDRRRHAAGQRGAVCCQGFQPFLQSRAPSLLLKTVHDFYNRDGLEVTNALGQTWLTIGDAHLGGSPDTIAMAEQASLGLPRRRPGRARHRRQHTGAERALDLIPDLARVAGGPVPADRVVQRRPRLSGTRCSSARSTARRPTTTSTRWSRATSSRWAR